MHKFSKIWLGLLFCLFCLDSNALAKNNPRKILLTIYSHLDLIPWFPKKGPITGFPGVEEYDKSHHAISLNLSGMKLKTEGFQKILPLLKKINLKRLNLSNNNIEAPVGYSFQGLNNLESLNLSLNQFKGSLFWLEKLTKLRHLNLSYNNFTGTVQGNNLSNELEFLDLSHNKLNGFISGDFSSGTELKFIFLNNNNFATEYFADFSLPKFPKVQNYILSGFTV